MRGGFGEAPAQGCDTRPPSPSPPGGGPTAPARRPLKPPGKRSAAGAGGVPARLSPLRCCRGAPRPLQPSLPLVGSAEVRVRSRTDAARGRCRGTAAGRQPPRSGRGSHRTGRGVPALTPLSRPSRQFPPWLRLCPRRDGERGGSSGRLGAAPLLPGRREAVPLTWCRRRCAAPEPRPRRAGGERRPRSPRPAARGNAAPRAGKRATGGWHRLRGDGTRWPGARDGAARPSWPQRAGGGGGYRRAAPR